MAEAKQHRSDIANIRLPRALAVRLDRIVGAGFEKRSTVIRTLLEERITQVEKELEP